MIIIPGIIQVMGSAKDRRRSRVMPPVIGWTQNQNDISLKSIHQDPHITNQI